MTDQAETVEIVDNVPVKYVDSTYLGSRVRVPVKAVRRTCEVCGNEYWAWQNDFGYTCARCRARNDTGGRND